MDDPRLQDLSAKHLHQLADQLMEAAKGRSVFVEFAAALKARSLRRLAQPQQDKP